jgi:sn-glycerol 3-phosphate transport system substrate-binding protein
MKSKKCYLFQVLAISLASVCVVGMIPRVSQAVTEITFWHSYSGKRLPAVQRFVNAFNAAQSDVKVNAQFMGRYEEVLAKTIAAVRAGKPPHTTIVGSGNLQLMIDSGTAIPAHELFKPGEADFGDIIWPIRDRFALRGKVFAIPLGSSTGILYYNKDLFRKAGLDPNKPPTTYKDLAEVGRKLVNSKVVPNALSTGWPAWLLEMAHSYHSQFYVNNANGRKARATKVLFNSKLGVQYAEWFTQMSKEKVYIYGGKEYSANKAFLAQQIPMLIQSTSSVASLEDATKEFLKWIMRPETTMQWHKDTGYAATSKTALKKLTDEGWFIEHPNHLTGFLQMLSGTKTPGMEPFLFGQFYEIRKHVHTAFEYSFSGKTPPKAALDEAAKKANRILQEYADMYK